MSPSLCARPLRTVLLFFLSSNHCLPHYPSSPNHLLAAGLKSALPAVVRLSSARQLHWWRPPLRHLHQDVAFLNLGFIHSGVSVPWGHLNMKHYFTEPPSVSAGRLLIHQAASWYDVLPAGVKAPAFILNSKIGHYYSVPVRRYSIQAVGREL